jgi:hypothetical protein
MSSKKQCLKCSEEKVITEFHHDKSRNDGIHPYCKACKKQSDRKYREKNLDKIRTRDKQYCLINKERQALKAKIWYANNKDKRHKTRKQLYDNNVSYRIMCVVGSRIRKCLHSKRERTIDILGCSTSFFKCWIESQFTISMNWDNMGTYWHLDHVKPCASFNFENESEIYECFNWSNIRPLNGKENIQKSNKIDIPLIIHQNKLAWKFLTSDDVPS